jgi:hypothetical protein
MYRWTRGNLHWKVGWLILEFRGWSLLVSTLSRRTIGPITATPNWVPTTLELFGEYNGLQSLELGIYGVQIILFPCCTVLYMREQEVETTCGMLAVYLMSQWMSWNPILFRPNLHFFTPNILKDNSWAPHIFEPFFLSPTMQSVTIDLA